jgi:hypothetical protein
MAARLFQFANIEKLFSTVERCVNHARARRELRTRSSWLTHWFLSADLQRV